MTKWIKCKEQMMQILFNMFSGLGWWYLNFFFDDINGIILGNFVSAWLDSMSALSNSTGYGNHLKNNPYILGQYNKLIRIQQSIVGQ